MVDKGTHTIKKEGRDDEIILAFQIKIMNMRGSQISPINYIYKNLNNQLTVRTPTNFINS